MQPKPGQQSAEAVLVIAAQGGDMAAFEALYRQYFGAVYDFAVRTMKDTHSASDAVQDAFMKAHEKIGQLRDPEAFRPWLYAIVRREALGTFRSQARETSVAAIEQDGAGFNPLLDQVDDDLASDPAAAAELSDSASLVWEAAASLDADTYTVLDLHVRQGLGSAEIAEVLGISKGNAYTKLNRMKERTGTAISTYLLIRKGSKDCDELAGIVAGVEFPPVTETFRKRVDRHAKACDECSERRRGLVSPMSIFAALAAVPPPAGLEEAIWGTISTSASEGSRGLRRRSVWALTLIGVFLAALGLASFLGTGSIGNDVLPASGDEGVVLAAETTTSVEVKNVDVDSETTTSFAGAGSVVIIGHGFDTGLVPIPSPAPPVAATTTSSAPEPSQASDSTPPETTRTTEAPPPAAQPAPVPPPAKNTSTTASTSPPATTPTLPQPPPDATPPSIGNLSASPGQISELDGFGISCPAGTSRLSKISAFVADAESGVSTVSASWAIGGSSSAVSMVLIGGSYTTDFGPFQAGTVPDNTAPSITITITAVDNEGNQSVSATGVVVDSIAKCFI
jgi:RNA polymerase sigma factor (sigma-70 family)